MTSPLSVHLKISFGVGGSYIRVPNVLFFMFTIHAALNVCKSELVRDGDFQIFPFFHSFHKIYSYLLVGVGLAQNFKPITNFTRDFCAICCEYIRKENFPDNFSLKKSFAFCEGFCIKNFMKSFQFCRKLLCLLFIIFRERPESFSFLCIVLCSLKLLVQDMMKIYVHACWKMEKSENSLGKVDA